MRTSRAPSWMKSIARLRGWEQSFSQRKRPALWRTRHPRIESLEPRQLLTGDGLGDDLLLADPFVEYDAQPAIFGEMSLMMAGGGGGGSETYTVTSLEDDNGEGLTLREALVLANSHYGADLVQFDSSLFDDGQGGVVPGTITLENGYLPINDSVTITGPGADLLLIDADGGSQVFLIGPAMTTSFAGMTMTGGATTDAGGAIRSYYSGTAIAVADSVITGNQATGDGGAIYGTGNITITNSIISGNTAGDDGGGVFAPRNVIVTNSALTDNTAGDDGGGICSVATAGYTFTVTNATIADNTADLGSGGGIYVGGYGTASVRNSIVSLNEASSDSDISGSYSADHSLVATDPEFEDVEAGDLRLSSSSTAINAGDNDLAAGIDYDLDGNPRVFDEIVDAGAYEYSYAEGGGGGLAISGTGETEEGQPYTAILTIPSAPGPWSWVLTWGDGDPFKVTSPNWGSGVVKTNDTTWEATHTYADAGPYTFKVTCASADANFDGDVDADDANILAAHWGQTGMTWAEGDFNWDGAVNVVDFSILAANWGSQSYAGSCEIVVTLPTQPAPPTALAATPASDTEISLNWSDNADNEMGYEVERMTNDTPWSVIATLDANAVSFSDTTLSEGELRYYRVRATHPFQDSAYSNMTYATTLPAAPSDLSVASISAAQVSLTWLDDSSIETHYVVERLVDTVWEQLGESLDPDATAAMLLADFAPSTEYRFRVRAIAPAYYADDQYSLPSNEAAETTDDWPAAPTDLAATAASDVQIDLSWTDSATDETAYDIEYCEDCATWTLLTTLGANATNYSHTGLTASEGIARYYRVRATNATGPSPYSNTASVATSLLAPTGLQAIVTSGGEMQLEWQDHSALETGYSAEQWIDSDWQQVATAEADALTQVITGTFEPSVDYSFRVRAFVETQIYFAGEYDYSTFNYSLPSNVATATPPASWPSAPSNLDVVSVSESRLDLAWLDNATNETAYEIERSEDGSAWGLLTTLGAGATSYSDTGLTEATPYYYRVRATNASGASGYSVDANGTLPAQPTNLLVTTINGDEMGLQWADHSASEEGYSIEQWIDDGWEEIEFSDPDVTNCTVTGVFEPLSSYSFRVKAWTPWAESVPSATETAATPGWPAAPTNLVATPVSAAEIALSWTGSAGAEDYVIEMQEVGASAWTVLGEVSDPQTTFNAIGLEMDAGYVFRTSATNVAGRSASTRTSVVMTQNQPPTIVDAWSSQNPVTGTITRLWVTADDELGASLLKYKWSLVSSPSNGNARFDNIDASPYLHFLKRRR